MSWFRRALREPLLHFVVLGGLVFAAGRALSTDEAQADAIVVDDALVERLRAELSQSLGQPPTPAQVDIAIERWIDEELLYREGVALGLDQHDPTVRKRVIQKMEFITADPNSVPTPDEATLRQFMADNPRRYAGSSRADFVLVTIANTDDVESSVPAAIEALRSGADPHSVGGRVSTGKKFSASSAKRTYGPKVAAAIGEQEIGQWGVVDLDRATGLLKVTGRHPGQPRPFEEAKNRVTLDWTAAQRAEALRERLDELRTKYPIRNER